jgi:HPt (histidine-containing phosphotransfer) domain-containing protein
MEPIDWSALRENCAGDDSLVEEVLELFRREGPNLLADVGAAVKGGNPLAVKHTAHRLKGALASLAAQPCVLTSRELESMGSKGELSQAPQMYAQLEKEMRQLLAAITQQRAA